MAHHDKPDIFNADQGSHFTGSAFAGVLVGNAIAIGIDGKAAWRDNVLVERLWRSVRCEVVYRRARDRHAARSAATSTSTIAAAHVRASTARHTIELTSPRGPSAWQPDPGGRTAGDNFSRSP